MSSEARTAIPGLIPKLPGLDTRRSASASCSTSGQPVGLSFINPVNADELARRRVMMSHWAHTSYGMMGRTPDFLNVSIMAMAGAADYFSQNRPEFKENVQRYYEYVRENDLVLTHTLVNLQRTRTPMPTPIQDRTDVALAVVNETADGIVVHDQRPLHRRLLLRTLGNRAWRHGRKHLSVECTHF